MSDPEIPHSRAYRLTRFDRALVRVEVDGEPLYLDPADRGLVSGRLPPDLEGTEALVFDSKHPETVTLPETPASGSVRQAQVRLTLDEAGRLAGDGSLTLTGHHARRFRRVMHDPQELFTSWQAWAAESLKGYEVTDHRVEERLDSVRLVFSFVQPEDDVLGDESSFAPSRPLGPVEQPFTLPPERRRTPVQLPYPDRDELVLELTWPEGWVLDTFPGAVRFDSEVGLFETQVQVDPAARTLTFRRIFEVREHTLWGRDLYAEIRGLYDAASRSDARDVVLVLE